MAVKERARRQKRSAGDLLSELARDREGSEVRLAECQAFDRHGRLWTATVVSQEDAEEADFRFWFEGLTPEERVNAVADCLLSSLKARGIREIPRLRRVRRILTSRRS